MINENKKDRVVRQFVTYCRMALNMDSISFPSQYGITKQIKLKGSANMKIVLITGSPRKKGTSNLLAEHFIKGAEEDCSNL